MPLVCEGRPQALRPHPPAPGLTLYGPLLLLGALLLLQPEGLQRCVGCLGVLCQLAAAGQTLLLLATQLFGLNQEAIQLRYAQDIEIEILTNGRDSCGAKCTVIQLNTCMAAPGQPMCRLADLSGAARCPSHAPLARNTALLPTAQCPLPTPQPHPKPTPGSLPPTHLLLRLHLQDLALLAVLSPLRQDAALELLQLLQLRVALRDGPPPGRLQLPDLGRFRHLPYHGTKENTAFRRDSAIVGHA